MGNQVTTRSVSSLTNSGGSEDAKAGTVTSVQTKSLSGNLMRSQHSRDPMKYYQVVEMLGEGSMGSVAKVLDTAVGGSARNDFVNKENGCCFKILSFCPTQMNKVKGKFIDMSSHGTAPTSATTSQSSSRGTGKPPKNRKVLQHASSSLITYGPKKDVYYALKTLHLDRCKNKALQEELKNEVEILRSLDHPNIVKAIEQFSYRDRLWLVLELCSGGDLYSRDPYTEDRAKEIIVCLLSAVAYLHSKNIIHRDLKFENIMFVDASPTAEVKIIDFGLSKKYAANLHDAVGTVYTMAPELLGQNYDNKADIWSLGVITFMLLSSSMPFYGKDRTQVIKRIIRGKFSFTARRWEHVSMEAQEFVTQLLSKDPTKRPSANEALESFWITGEVSEAMPEAEKIDEVFSTIEAFANYGKLKKLALMVIAYKSTTEEVGFLRNMFAKFDRLKDGEISLAEFKEAFADEYDYSDEELEKIFNGIDIDGTGKVHYCEFLASTIEAHGELSEERLAEAFDRIDGDDSGFITVGDLQEFLGSDIPEKYLDDIIDEADLTQDHRISYDEFLALWNDVGDQALEHAKVQVKARRLRHETSALSSQSSFDNVTDSERNTVSETSSVVSSDTAEGGGYYYNKMKDEYSVRGDWV